MTRVDNLAFFLIDPDLESLVAAGGDFRREVWVLPEEGARDSPASVHAELVPGHLFSS